MNKVEKVADAMSDDDDFLPLEEPFIENKKADKVLEEDGDMEDVKDEDEDQADEWIEDTDEKIMDAKVMKKGDKKLIIVDLPNPKARWLQPKE